MPCSDGGPSPQQVEDARNIPAMLCALLTLLENRDLLEAAIDNVDFQEAGITRDWFTSWWRQHKADDADRREMERLRVGRGGL